MNKTYTHKGINFELEEIQGFYNCFVFAEGDSTPLFQTKYFASAEKAISEAVNFIEDYHAYTEAKRKKKRTRSRKPKKDKTKKRRTEIKEKGRITPTSKPKDEKSRTHTPKHQDSKRNRIAGILQALLILGAFLLIITIVAYGYSEYLVSRPRQVTPEATRTGVPGVGVSLPSPRETIVLPQVSQSQTPTPAVTPTLTSTITATSTFFTTQPSKTPRNTSRPTNPPIQTNTPSPTNTFTPAPTMTPTLSPAPTTGPPPPPWATPETPTPTPGT